jgi:hypothetical protein
VDGVAATAAHAQLLWTGSQLLYDPDGTGAAAAVLITQIDGGVFGRGDVWLV